jgi:hypothetical protein
MIEIVTWISLISSVSALIISYLSWHESRRSAIAAEDSAREAGRGNEIALFGQIQQLMQNFQAEIEQVRSSGSEAQIKALEYVHGMLIIETLKKFASKADAQAREKFVEYFSRIAVLMPEDKRTIEQLVTYVLADENHSKD